ncbi:MAG: GGDEF domain-containing protein [Lachnospiraceae bacterium]|nr:GGDEF domain-containing protein [Lachnospiraceae bacterium]MBQ8666736.1 GGDEF domain-containing protein [Lachnospiraceae bacterium]
MGFDYFVFYTEASLICVIILSTILVADRMYNTKQEKQVWFRRAIVAFMLYFISDAFWAAMLSGEFTVKRSYVVLVNLSNYILLGLMAYGLFMFIAASEKMPFRKDAVKRRLIFLPVIISTLAISIAYVKNPLFWVNEQNELNNLYFPLMIVAPSIYLWAGFGLSVRYAVKSVSKMDKRRFLAIGSIPVAVMAFGMLQVFALKAPTFCFGCTVMWLFYYLENMQTMISVDDLTHLNNRGQINRYLEQIHYNKDIRVIIMMIDINKFKTINDTYGHAEGDRALVIVSEALRQTCEQIKASVFLGRYGGDEFTIVVKNPEEDIMPEQMVSLMRSILTQKATENQLPYDLNVSIGYDLIRGSDDDANECLKRADKNLYIDKQRKGE